MYQSYLRALARIGIDLKEARKRGLSLHAWLLNVAQATSFLNTELQVAGVSIPKVQSVTGHKTDRMTPCGRIAAPKSFLSTNNYRCMTEWYSHFDPKEFTDVREAQEALLQPETQKTDTAQTPETEKLIDRKDRERVIPFRSAENPLERKQA
jgi:hypothetical protein